MPPYVPIPNATPEPDLVISQIDPAFPVFGNPTTASVRSNFAAAKSEIEELQDGKLDLAGGVMTGPIVFVPAQDVDGGQF